MNETVRLMLGPEGDINDTSNTGVTPLTLANNKGTAAFIIESVGQLSHVDQDGDTALHTRNSRLEMVKYFVERCLSIYTGIEYGETAYDFTSSCSFTSSFLIVKSDTHKSYLPK